MEKWRAYKSSQYELREINLKGLTEYKFSGIRIIISPEFVDKLKDQKEGGPK